MPARYMHTPGAYTVTCRKAHLKPRGQSPKCHNLITECSPISHITACVREPRVYQTPRDSRCPTQVTNRPGELHASWSQTLAFPGRCNLLHGTFPCAVCAYNHASHVWSQHRSHSTQEGSTGHTELPGLDLLPRPQSPFSPKAKKCLSALQQDLLSQLWIQA